jgi:hypothetical protein
MNPSVQKMDNYLACNFTPLSRVLKLDFSFHR